MIGADIVAQLASSKSAQEGVIGVLAAAFLGIVAFFIRKSGKTSAELTEAKKDSASDAQVVTVTQNMAKADAQQPTTNAELIDTLKKGDF